MDPFTNATWNEDNVKNLLQFFFQSQFRPDSLPQYHTISEGPAHMKKFCCKVQLPPLQMINIFVERNRQQGLPTEEWTFGYGEGKTKKDAEKKAAADACRKLEHMGILQVPAAFRELPRSFPTATTTTTTNTNSPMPPPTIQMPQNNQGFIQPGIVPQQQQMNINGMGVPTSQFATGAGMNQNQIPMQQNINPMLYQQPHMMQPSYPQFTTNNSQQIPMKSELPQQQQPQPQQAQFYASTPSQTLTYAPPPPASSIHSTMSSFNQSSLPGSIVYNSSASTVNTPTGTVVHPVQQPQQQQPQQQLQQQSSYVSSPTGTVYSQPSTSESAGRTPQTMPTPPTQQSSHTGHPIHSQAYNSERVAIIVGVGSNLGSSIALRFAKEGFRLGLIGRNSETLRRVEKEIQSINPQAQFASEVVPDSTWNVRQTVNNIRSKLGDKISVLVYNWYVGSSSSSTSSVSQQKSIKDLDISEFENTWKTNCLGAFAYVKELLQNMIDQQSATILFSGCSQSINGTAFESAACSSKFALRGLCHSLAREYGAVGIHSAHVVIDGLIARRGESTSNTASVNQKMNPDHIADIFYQIHTQQPTSWTLELDLRPIDKKN